MIIRNAIEADAPQMCDLLNAIIKKGGTTAHETPYDHAKMIADYVSPARLISCHVADDDGQILGFQFLAYPNPEPPASEGWGIIATFVADGMAGRGVGKRLFTATCEAGRSAGVISIDATIRADNTSGLGYYGAMGFVDYDVLRDVPLRDGTPVDRIRKQFDL